jgi:hypothetical protein
MKVTEILSEVTKGNWKISNLMGWEKVFKDEQSPAAQAWMKNRDKKPASVTKLSDYEKSMRAFDKLMAKQAKDADKKMKAIRSDDDAIFKRVENAIESMFDGVEPIDHLIPWMDRTGVTMDDIDRAVAKHEGRGKKKYGMYDWMADMWEDRCSDQMSDAKHGGADPNSEFYTIEKDGKITKSQNPWKSH